MELTIKIEDVIDYALSDEIDCGIALKIKAILQDMLSLSKVCLNQKKIYSGVLHGGCLVLFQPF